MSAATASAPSADATTSADAAVSVRGLAKRFGATAALGGISFDVRPRAAITS